MTVADSLCSDQGSFRVSGSSFYMIRRKNMENMFRIGVITLTHGLLGEVKVFPTTEDPGRFLDLEEVIVKKDRRETVLKIRKVRFFKQFVMLSFEGLDRIEDAEPYVKGELYVTRENAIPLEEGEYYIADLYGMKVISDEGEDLGILDDVMETGANDVYIVKKNGEELLLPAIPECIRKVDPENGTMIVHLMKGLR